MSPSAALCRSFSNSRKAFLGRVLHMHSMSCRALKASRLGALAQVNPSGMLRLLPVRYVHVKVRYCVGPSDMSRRHEYRKYVASSA